MPHPLLVLNVPNPYARGNNLLGGSFGIQVNGQLLPPTATFTYNEQAPGGSRPRWSPR
jgi:hypothetical protein